MPFSFLYSYFTLIAYLGSDLAGPIRNTKKIEHWVCGFTIMEYKINCNCFNKKDED